MTASNVKRRIVNGVCAGIIALFFTTHVGPGGVPIEVAGSAIANSILWGAVIVGVLR